MSEKGRKIFKVVASLASLIAIALIILLSIDVLKYVVGIVKRGLSSSYRELLNKYYFTLIAYTINIALILTFNYFLWFKSIFEFVSPEKIAERKAAKAAAKKQKLEEKLKNL